MNTTLRTSETSVAVSLLLIIASLTIIAKYNAAQARFTCAFETLPDHEPYPVKISGAVKKPGSYRIMPGTLMRDAVKRASPKRFANLKNLGLDDRIEGPTEIFIEEVSEISIYVKEEEGELVQLTMPVGSRVSDLKRRFPQKKSVLQSRRMLKDGEILDLRKERG